mgnify:CR=1 FL=1
MRVKLDALHENAETTGRRCGKTDLGLEMPRVQNRKAGCRAVPPPSNTRIGLGIACRMIFDVTGDERVAIGAERGIEKIRTRARTDRDATNEARRMTAVPET